MAATSLEDRIRKLPCWTGRVELEPLKGGISNTSFIVTDRKGRFVARCGGDIAVHHVFRDRERAVSEAAHRAGLSPELIYAEPGIMVFRYIDGRPFSEADMRGNVERIVPLITVCHRTVGRFLTGPPQIFWVFHVIRDYASTLRKGKARNAENLAQFVELANLLEERQLPQPIVFGHHDLLPGNFLDDGERLWLIDWEYGGFGTPLFDLANIAANGSFAEEQEQALLDIYYGGKPSAELQRSFDAMKVASSLREALWAMVSEIHLNAPGADYVGHAEEYLRRTNEAVKRFNQRHGRL
jgi:thiamine kinase-like enzyme